MSRNFGAGTRDMIRASEKILRCAVQRKEVSYATARTNVERFAHFARYAKGNGIGRMERITSELVETYGCGLAEKAAAGKISVAYAQNLVSSVNTVMKIATRGQWQSISPTIDCSIPKRCCVRNEPTPEPDVIVTEIAAIKAQGLIRSASVAELAFHFGLRSKEASMLDTVRVLIEARKDGQITVTERTKGGLKRIVHIRQGEQLDVLARAAYIQGNARCLIPPKSTGFNGKTQNFGKVVRS